MIRKTQLLHYGFLAMPVAFAGFPLYILAPDFYATHYGVSLTSLGIILLCLRAFDAVQDPFIGQISDRFYGKMLPIITASAIILVLSLYFLFNPVGTHVLLWFTVTMLLAVLAYSIININLGSLGALWSDDKNEQTRISASRESFALLGLLLAVSLPAILGNYFPTGQVFYYFSIILAGLMAVALFAFQQWFKHYPSTSLKFSAEKHSLFQSLKTLPVQTKKLLLVYGVSVLASSIPAILVIFFVRDRLQAEEQLGLFLFLYFISGAAAMPLWKKISEKEGKYNAWLFATILAAISLSFAFFLEAGDIWQYGVICIASGMALGADLVLPPSILADQIHEYDSKNSAAIQFSILALLTKAGLAVGSAVMLPTLDLYGFKPGQANAYTALTALNAAYALIPSILKLAAAYLLYRLFIFNQKEITNEKHLKNSIYGNRDNAC